MKFKSFFWDALLIIFFFSFSFAFADSTTVEKVDEGVFLYNYYFSKGPIVAYVVEVDLTKQSYRFDIGLTGDMISSKKLKNSEIAARYSSDSIEVLVSVNADFFGGNPHQFENSLISNGKLIKGTNLKRSQIAFKDRKPFIEIFQYQGLLIIKGDTFFISKFNDKREDNELILYDDFYGNLATENDSLEMIALMNLGDLNDFYSGKYIAIENKILDEEKYKKKILFLQNYLFNDLKLKLTFGDTVEVINTFKPFSDFNALTGGLPGLIKDGIKPDNFIGIENIRSERFINKNPRTAVGFNKDTSKFYFVVVDGRQEQYSIGMSLNELADFMSGLGITNALNLDGGGSSSLVIKNRLINKPSDATGERPVCNSLMLLKNK